MSGTCYGLQVKRFTRFARIEFPKIQAQPWIPVSKDWTEAPNFARLQCSSTCGRFGGEGCHRVVTGLVLDLSTTLNARHVSTCVTMLLPCAMLFVIFRYFYGGANQLSPPTARC